MAVSECFGANYADARYRFLTEARRAGARLRHHRLPHADGPAGEPLSMDVAVLGAEDAERCLFLICGTHGVEGLCGSGCQVGFLRDRLYEAMPAATRVVLVHAVNPHGFAWCRRVNEDNVDLNRNFCDFARPLPSNTRYDSMHPWLVPADWDGEARRTSDAALLDYVATHGLRSFQAAVGAGQYTHPDGLFYGGSRETWSARTFRRVVRRAVTARIRRVIAIEFHSGLGPFGYGEPIHLGRTAEESNRARAWFGPEVTNLHADGAGSPPINGHLANAFARLPASVELTYLVLEYGTRPYLDILTALRADNWLHAVGGLDDAHRDQIKRQMREAFFVDTPAWKAAVYGRAADFIMRAARGLSDRAGAS